MKKQNKHRPNRGKVFVVSAPSGSGKTTLCQRLIRSRPGKKRLLRSISVTTRKKRKGEREGRDYFFISRPEFLKRRKRGQFLESARVLGHFYGTPRDFVQKQLKRGRNVLLEIDVQGAQQIKRKLPQAVLIFILPPSFKELRARLCKRSTENSRQVSRRLKLARTEIGFIKKYNYVVLNDTINLALARLKAIIRQEGKS